jgi:hypothetical protein
LVLGCVLETSSALQRRKFEKFLDLWNDADPGIAEVEDAKKPRELKDE